MEERTALSDFLYVASDADLQSICDTLGQVSWLAFDSEFVRTNTYFPKPGLFQLCHGTCTWLVDPLTIDDWTGFAKLICQDSVTLIIHSSSEDLGLLRCFLGVLPARLFDTQRAAAFAGYGYSLSYQALVEAELGIVVPKGETRSDWLRRPLSDNQLEYAALDVTHLVELAERLTVRLTELGRLAWFEEDCRELLTGVPDEFNSGIWESAYRTIGGAWQLSTPQLAVLQKLAFWREQQARKRDKPRNWILRDQELLELARHLGDRPAVAAADIASCQGLPARFVERDAARLARYLDEHASFSHPVSHDMLLAPLSAGGRKKLKALQALTRRLAESLDISPELLARKRLWLELLDNHTQQREPLWPAGLDNWRRPLLEAGVLAILGPGPACEG